MVSYLAVNAQLPKVFVDDHDEVGAVRGLEHVVNFFPVHNKSYTADAEGFCEAFDVLLLLA